MNSICAILHPNPLRWRKAEQALSHPWLMSFAALMEHNHCGLRENFDPRPRWHDAIGVERATSRFAKSKSANNNRQDHPLVLTSDDEDNEGSRGGRRGRAPIVVVVARYTGSRLQETVATAFTSTSIGG